MDFSKKLSQVREQLDEENLSKVSATLKELEVATGSIADDLKAANGESRNRKVKLREAESKIQDLELKIGDLEKASDHSELTKELETLKAFKTSTLKHSRETFQTDFAKIAKHKNFVKAKDVFDLPKPDKDGNYDLKGLTDEQVEKNTAELLRLTQLEYFGTAGNQDVHGDKNDTPPGSFREQVRGTKSIAELEQLAENMPQE